jgi:hypothetical protein
MRYLTSIQDIARIQNIYIFIYIFPDIDNNGYLDAHDFQCLALRSCVLEGKGDCSAARLQKYQHIMLSLWEEIAQLADFDKVPDYVGYPPLLTTRHALCFVVSDAADAS